MRALIASALLAVCLAGGARADALGEAWQAYAQGAYAAAAEQADAAGGVEGHVMAARAINTRLVIEGSNAADARRAQRHAEAALDVEPDHVEALIQRAAAVGFEARVSSDLANYFRGSARRVRDSVDQALRLAPGDARARAVSGAWHLELVWRGGDAARSLYGADVQAGLAEFEAALRLGADPMAGVQFAALLVALDAEAHRARALDALDWTLEQPAELHVDEIAHARAAALNDAIDEPERRQALLARWLEP